MQSQKTNYLEPADFFRETIICLKKDEMSEELGSMFYMLCEKYANHPRFVRYRHIRDDLISFGLLACIKGFPKFRPYRNDLVRDDEGNIIQSTKREWDGEIIEYDYRTCNNPFAFFTTCATNEILQFLKSEYNYKNIINKMRLENGMEADAGYTDMMKEREMAEKLENGEEVDITSELDEDTQSIIEWENGHE